MPPTSPTSPGTPPMPEVDPQSIEIEPYVVDEWYGIRVLFHWKVDQQAPESPFPIKDVSPNSPAGRQLMVHVFTHVRQSDAWTQFYAQRLQVSCDRNGSDDEQRMVTIPQFTPQDADNHGEWEYSETEGVMLISLR